MRVVNIKELKAKLSAYLREVDRGETFLVTDRSRVCATLGPPPSLQAADPVASPPMTRLVAMGFRPPLRERRPTDQKPLPPGPGLSAEQIQRLVDETREDRDI